MPVMSPASNLAMAKSSDFCRLLFILWQMRRLRSMDRPSSWTWRWRSRVTYLAEHKTRTLKMRYVLNVSLTTYLFGGGVLMNEPSCWHSCLNRLSSRMLPARCL